MRNPAIFTAKIARDWTDAWQAAAGDKTSLKIPLQLMEVGTRFIETGDRSVLLELPLEQRSLLEPEIDRHLRATGKLRTDVDRDIDELIEKTRRKVATRAEVSRRSGHAGKQNVAAPPRVDDARIDSVLAAYDVERTIASDVQPLLSGEWSAVPRESVPRLLRLLADSRTAAAVELSRRGLSILRLDQLRLEFAKGFLYQAHIDVNGRIGSLDFWSDGDRAVLLDGSSPPIYSLVADGAIDTVGENELPYLIFFCSTLRGDMARFPIVLPADTTVVSAAKSKAPTLSIMQPAPKKIEGKNAFEVHLIYADTLFRSVLTIDHERNGLVEMVEEERLLENLGLPRESFDGAVRFRVGAEEPDLSPALQ